MEPVPYSIPQPIVPVAKSFAPMVAQAIPVAPAMGVPSVPIALVAPAPAPAPVQPQQVLVAVPVPIAALAPAPVAHDVPTASLAHGVVQRVARIDSTASACKACKGPRGFCRKRKSRLYICGVLALRCLRLSPRAPLTSFCFTHHAIPTPLALRTSRHARAPRQMHRDAEHVADEAEEGADADRGGPCHGASND